MKRRTFFKIFASALGIGALSAIPVIVDSDFGTYSMYEPIDIKSLNSTINFIEKVIVIKNNNKFEIFSDTCPHLGCKINNFSGDSIICPCHGSHFDLEGKVIKGPANKSLKKLNFKIISGKLIISKSKNEAI